jgi:hypothetical protein
MAPISTDRPGLLGRFTAEYQIGDPTAPSNAWRPWKRRKLSRHLRQEVEIGLAGLIEDRAK